MFNTTVEIMHRTVTGEDDYGNETQSFASAGVISAWVEQTGIGKLVDGSTEFQQERDTLVTSYLVLISADNAVDAYDRVLWSGITLEVDGTPAEAPTPQGTNHLELRCKEIEG